MGSAELSMKKFYACLNLENTFFGLYFFLLINVKMPTIVVILTFMTRINFSLSRAKHVKKVL